MNKRKICVVTGNRSEYGLLSPLIKLLSDDTEIDLQIIATGAHLSTEFGYTAQEIEQDGFKIDKKIEMLLSTSSHVGVAKSMGLTQISICEAFNELSPDIIVVLGDRYEILSVVSTALIFNIPVAHFSGGEITEGAIDDSIRHAVTKMSHIHFTAMEEYRKRIIQLGENPDNIFNIGEIGLDKIKNTTLLTREELEIALAIKLKAKNILLAYHPVTLEADAEEKFKSILDALETLKDTFIIISYPNADAGGTTIIKMIEDYVGRNKENSKAFKSLGHLNFLSAIDNTDLVIGNSSSGIVEAPSFKKPSINIGNRQKGRIQAESTLNSIEDKSHILQAIETSYSADFQSKIKSVINPYGSGESSIQALNVLKSIKLDNIIKKKFYDIK